MEHPVCKGLFPKTRSTFETDCTKMQVIQKVLTNTNRPISILPSISKIFESLTETSEIFY